MQDTVREQLTALEIYSCPGLSLHWSIPHSSGTIYGQPEQGFVITQKSAEHIRVTISAHAVSGKSMPWSRLADELLDACNINADDKKRRIMQSMLAGDEDIIKDELWRASLICDMSLLVESSSEFPGEGPNDHAVVSAGASIVHEMSNTEPFTGSIASTNGGTFAGLAGSPSAGHSISYKRSSNSLSDRAKKTKHVDIAAIAKAGAAFSLSTLGAVTGGVSQQSNPKNDRYTNETLQRLPSSRHATLGSVVFSPSSGESTEYQQQIGFGGEVYVRVTIGHFPSFITNMSTLTVLSRSMNCSRSNLASHGNAGPAIFASSTTSRHSLSSKVASQTLPFAIWLSARR